MDLYGSDKKLSELDHTDFGEFLNQSVFNAPPTSLEPYGIDAAQDMEDDWFENFFDAPADPVDCILHDKMMSEAMQSPQVKTEHSYSCANGATGNTVQTIEDQDKELDLELQRTLNPVNMTPTTQALNLCTSEINRAVNSIKTEPSESEVTTVTVTRTNPHTLLKQPTIILATQPQVQHIGHPCRTQERLVLPKVNIEVESQQQNQHVLSSPEHSSDYGYDALSLPPTPPSSNNSDSDGSQSPDRSAPNSPMRSTHLSRHTLRSLSPTQPLFMSPIPTSGVLILTEEEKRTLISEGYPIPQKLPLTKQEEKNLKKIRRKIKNKISAQESRRKKKEYLETLERKVESFSSENMDLKKKVDVLENNNRSLMSQLHKLQALAGKLTRPSSTSTQTGTCLMVFVLCFAVFLGSWSPMSLRVGYSGTNAGVSPSLMKQPMLEPSVNGGGGLDVGSKRGGVTNGGGGGNTAMGPELQTPISDVYSTPNMRSRVLLSVAENENEEEFGPVAPFSYKDFFTKWFSSASQRIGPKDETLAFEPPLPKVEVLDVETEINQTGEGRSYASVPAQAPPPLHPDISVTTKQIDNTA